MLVAAALGAYAALAAWIPDYRDYGWAWRLPTWVLVRLYPWADRPDGARSISSVNRPVLIALSQRLYELDGREPQPRLAAKCLDELRTQTDVLRRRDAYILLGGCGMGAVPIDQLLAAALAEADPNLIGHAWNAIVGAAAHDAGARTHILERMRDHPDDTIVGMIKRLPERGEIAREYLPALVELIRTGEEATPAELCWKIMKMGSVAAAVAPELDSLKDANPHAVVRAYVAGAAACARGELAGDAQAFAGWLTSDDPQLRLTGAWMLASGELLQRGHAVTDEIVAALNALPADAPSALEDALTEAARQRGRRAMAAIPAMERIATKPGTPSARAQLIRDKIEYLRTH